MPLYHSDGTGRDCYIHKDNGGLRLPAGQEKKPVRVDIITRHYGLPTTPFWKEEQMSTGTLSVANQFMKLCQGVPIPEMRKQATRQRQLTTRLHSVAPLHRVMAIETLQQLNADGGRQLRQMSRQTGTSLPQIRSGSLRSQQSAPALMVRNQNGQYEQYDQYQQVQQ